MIKSPKRFTALLSIMLPAAFLFIGSLSHAEVSSSKDLIDNAKAMDGKQIVYEGEAITAILDRGEYSWVNIKDDYNAIGVWCKSSTLKQVNYLGTYKAQGDILQISGVFHRACPVHGGELDIHAESVRIVTEGYAKRETLNKDRLDIAAIVFVIVIIIAVIFRKRL